jgi:hypothetical protein
MMQGDLDFYAVTAPPISSKCVYIHAPSLTSVGVRVGFDWLDAVQWEKTSLTPYACGEATGRWGSQRDAKCHHSGRGVHLLAIGKLSLGVLIPWQLDKTGSSSRIFIGREYACPAFNVVKSLDKLKI